MQLSKHFKLEELVSPNDKAKPSKEVLENLKELCEEALEPLRNAIGKPLTITSGYRSPGYNASIGGAKGSQHTLGIAVDIAIPDADLFKVAAIATKIPAIGGIGIYPGRNFIHIDTRRRINDKPTFWKQEKGKYVSLTLIDRGKIRSHGGLV